jgi:hypothetical protein
LAYLWGDEDLASPLMGHIFAAGLEELKTAAEFFWRVHGEKLTDDEVDRVLAFWTKCLTWTTDQKAVPVTLLSSLSRLAPYLNSLDARAKELLLAVVPYVHTEYYLTDRMIEELVRLVDSNPSATAEVLERMLDPNARNYDMDDKLKGLIQTLAALGLRAEAIRCAEKLQMINLYKQLVAGAGAN